MTVSISGTSGLSVNSLPFVVGQVCFFAMQTSPTGFLVCDGSAVSRTTYASVFAAIGTLYGAGNGSTTFNLPDLRGEFIRGYDGGRGIDSGRSMGSSQSYQVSAHQHTMTPNYVGDAGFEGPIYAVSQNTSGGVTTVSSETRPRNVALLPCIFVGV